MTHNRNRIIKDLDIASLEVEVTKEAVKGLYFMTEVMTDVMVEVLVRLGINIYQHRLALIDANL